MSNKLTKAKFVQALQAVDSAVVEQEFLDGWAMAEANYRRRLEAFTNSGWAVTDTRLEDALEAAFPGDKNKKSLYKKTIVTSPHAESIIEAGKAMYAGAAAAGLKGWGPDKCIRRVQTEARLRAPTTTWAAAEVEKAKVKADAPVEKSFAKVIEGLQKHCNKAARDIATEKSVAEFDAALTAACALLVSKAPKPATTAPAKPAVEQVDSMNGDELKALLAAVMAKLN